jgi:hypothetical protein
MVDSLIFGLVSTPQETVKTDFERAFFRPIDPEKT